MKKILLPVALSIFISFSAHSQQIIFACCDDTLCVPGASVDLVATVDSGYNTGTILNIADDTYSQVIDLGFTFNYWGNTYTQCILSTNAYIRFDIGFALQYSQWPINDAAPSTNNPLNAIYGPWHDVDPSVISNPTLAYTTFGTAPNRFFVYSFCSVPMFQCNDTLFTGQIVIHETTNIIEMFIGEKRNCYTWNGAAAIQGLQDATGTAAFIVPGRNYPDVWTAFNEGWRFTPDVNWVYTIDPIPFAPIPFNSGLPTWTDIDGNFVGQGFNITVTPNQTTTYIVKASSCGFAADTVTIVVSPVDADFTCPAQACVGDNIIFDNNSLPADFYDWDFGDGNTSNIADPTHTYNSSGTYTVQLICSTIYGCVDTMIQTITINPADITAQFVASEPFCVGKPITFTDQSFQVPASWNWDFGNGSVSTEQNPTYTYNSSGTYDVVLLVGDSVCGESTATQTIEVNAFANPDLGPDTSLCIGETLVLDPNDTGETYSWSTSESTPTITISGPEVPTVYVVTIDNGGCKASDTLFVDVECVLELPNAFSPNGDGFNDILHPLGTSVADYTLVIYNRWGQEVYNIASSDLSLGWTGSYHGEEAETGVYVYVLKGNYDSGFGVTITGNVTLVR